MNEWDDEVEEEGERERERSSWERERERERAAVVLQRLTSQDTRANALSHTPHFLPTLKSFIENVALTPLSLLIILLQIRSIFFQTKGASPDDY